MTYRHLGQIAKSLLFGIFLLHFSPTSVAQNDNTALIDSLERVLKNAVEDTTKMNALAGLSDAFRFLDLEKAKSYCLQGITIAEKSKNIDRIASTYLTLSSYHYQGGGIDSMRIWAEKAMTVLNHPKDKKLLNLEGRAYTHLGIAAYSSGHLNKALEYYKEAEPRLNNEMLKIQNLANIGVVLRSTGEYADALDYFSKAKEYTVSANRKDMEAIVLSNIGNIYEIFKDYDKAIVFYENSLKLREEIKDENGKAYTLVGLGSVYENIDISKAKNYDMLALAKSRELKNEEGIVISLINLSNLYIKENQPDSALILSNESYAIAKNYPDGDIKKSTALKNFAAIFNLKKEYPKAFAYAKEAIKGYKISGETAGDDYLAVLKVYATSLQNTGRTAEAVDILMELDSLSNIRSTEQQKTATAAAEVTFRLREKELAFQKTEQENELKITKANARQNVFLSLLGGAGVILLLGFFAFRRNQKAKATIEAQKALVEQSLGEKEVLLKEIHHRVKNNLQIISGLLDKQARKASDETVKKLMREGQDRVQSMALIHQNLYQSDNMSSIDIKHYLEELTRNIARSQAAAGQNVEVALNVDDSKLDIDTAIPVGLILNELITNAYKYAFADRPSGMIWIEFQRQADKDFLLKVRDNGIGLPSDIDLRKAKSLGLNLVQGLVRQLEGTMNFAGTNEGTSFELRF